MFQANYVSGLRVYDISDRENLVEVAHYDTYNGPVSGIGFHGLWGTYAYYSDPTIVVGSDFSCGVYSWKFVAPAFPPTLPPSPAPQSPSSPPTLPPPPSPTVISFDTCSDVKQTFAERGCCGQSIGIYMTINTTIDTIPFECEFVKNSYEQQACCDTPNKVFDISLTP